MSFMYRDSNGNIVPSAYVQSLRRFTDDTLTPGQIDAVAPANYPAAVDDFEGIDAPDAFDPNRFPIVAAFDAAHYAGASVERYCAAAASNNASAALYPLLGPRQAPAILLPDEDVENDDLIDYRHYNRRTSDGLWVLVNESIISSTTHGDDDMDILPFERIGRHVSSDESNGEESNDDVSSDDEQN